MRLILHSLALVAVILFFGVSLVQLSHVIGIGSPWLVLLLMFYFLGLAKIAQPLLVLRMPGSLRPLRPWELDTHLYRQLGVLVFGNLLRRTPLRYLNASVYLAGEPRNLNRVRDLCESAEASHFWAMVLLLPYIAFAVVNRSWQIVLWFSLAQLFVNVYPILHLRYARGRLDRIERQIPHGTSEGINLAEKLAKLTEHWSPRVVAQMNDYQLKVVKLQGDFVWHDHKETDEVFLVLRGEMEIGFRDRAVKLKAGELFVVPKGVEHITRAADECHALLIEPRGVVNTGDAGGALTAEGDKWI